MLCLSIHEFGTFLASNFISKWSKKFSNPLFSFHSLKRSLHFYHLHRLGSRCRAGCPSSSVDSLMVLDQLIYSWKICIHFNFRYNHILKFFFILIRFIVDFILQRPDVLSNKPTKYFLSVKFTSGHQLFSFWKTQHKNNQIIFIS